MLFASASKIIRNWFLTLQPDNYLQFTKVGMTKGMDVKWEFMHWFMHLFIYTIVWKKEKLHQNSYTNFISEVVNIDFWQIWHFNVKGTGWVGLELEISIIFMQSLGRFQMWVTPYTSILTLTKLKYFMSKELSTKA